jgi:hypothetical protein
MFRGVKFRFKKMRSVVMYDRFENFGKIIKNSYWPIFLHRGSFLFFKNGDDDSLFP